MPQLSPMLGFVMFIFILSFYVVLMSAMNKKTPFISKTEMNKSKKISMSFFK
uniref:ATP synthase F0 subunit 8 n=1 Tax=Aldisa cooperi TaxID=2936545 RepID=UPI002008EE8E|nr:ATP synthase F0 subunit 8 [Aldisa cooperi]UPI11631.1 ATP synthase F0 subunit 8 [Aldisa cooperi]